jgi:hypothetical protein
MQNPAVSKTEGIIRTMPVPQPLLLNPQVVCRTIEIIIFVLRNWFIGGLYWHLVMLLYNCSKMLKYPSQIRSAAELYPPCG